MITLNTIPDELLLHILNFSSFEDLGRATAVCKYWKHLISNEFFLSDADLEKRFPTLKIMGQTFWETHVHLTDLDVTGARPLKKRMALPLLNEGMALLTIPKGLTLYKLMNLAHRPKKGVPTHIENISDKVFDKLRSLCVKKTYRLLITTTILKESQNLPLSAMKQLVKKIGCEIPDILPVATLAILTFMSSSALSPTRLYNSAPLTYTYCSEEIAGCNLVVGGFSEMGLNIGLPVDDSFSHVYGVGAMCKLV